MFDDCIFNNLANLSASVWKLSARTPLTFTNVGSSQILIWSFILVLTFIHLTKSCNQTYIQKGKFRFFGYCCQTISWEEVQIGNFHISSFSCLALPTIKHPQSWPDIMMRICTFTISTFSLNFLFIFSFSLHFLTARVPGCHKLCNPVAKDLFYNCFSRWLLVTRQRWKYKQKMGGRNVPENKLSNQALSKSCCVFVRCF